MIKNCEQNFNKISVKKLIKILVNHIIRLLRKMSGGYVFISTLGINGFDSQVMRGKSQQTSPPHNINFLSIKVFRKLFERAGLLYVMVTTPGQLDVDIVRNEMKRELDFLNSQQFLKNLLNNEINAQTFQQFLVNQKLSSHVLVMGRKANIEQIYL